MELYYDFLNDAYGCVTHKCFTKVWGFWIYTKSIVRPKTYSVDFNNLNSFRRALYLDMIKEHPLGYPRGAGGLLSYTEQNNIRKLTMFEILLLDGKIKRCFRQFDKYIRHLKTHDTSMYNHIIRYTADSGSNE